VPVLNVHQSKICTRRYYRWIGWFSNDDKSYFEIFDIGDNEPFSWVDGETKYGFLIQEVEGTLEYQI